MTIERVILIKLADENVSSSGRDECASAARACMKDEPEATLFVGLPADKEALRSWDLALRLTCSSAEAFDRVRARAPYRGLLAALDERSIVVKAWSFQTE